MPRIKRGFKARRRRNRILNQAEGFFGGRKNRFRQAVEVVRHAWEYGYISRKLKSGTSAACGSPASTPRPASTAPRTPASSAA
jgi:hypothetical protein